MNDLDDIILDQSKTLYDAMQVLQKNERGILFVTDNRKIIGVATDGDIRRSLLRGVSLESNIKDAMNSKFTALPVSASDSLIRKSFKPTLRLIPLCDEKGNLVDFADAQKSHRIPLLEPDLTGEELQYVVDCIKSNWISSQGSYVRRFEQQFEEMHRGTYALAVSNGTVALHLALHSLGIAKDDEVIVPNITFAATINAVLYCNATPVLCEIDSETLCIDVGEAEKLISDRTKAILPVHLYGQPCDMDAMRNLAQKYNLLLIEDCAEAIGSIWREEPVGGFGDAATFSFFGNKTISTGEGGMILFKDREVFEHAKILRDHGMSPILKYWHNHVGFNYRLTNIQAAIGVAQMERRENIFISKLRIAALYTKILEGAPWILKLPPTTPGTTHSSWLYTILLDKNINRDIVITELLKFGVESRPVFYPLHMMPPYKNFAKSKSLKNSITASSCGISLPSSVRMNEDEVIYAARCLEKVISKL
jgi:perosamine synthetase